MSQGISFSGLGSGLDTDAIIKQLTDIERRPIGLIQTRQARLQQQKGVIQQINSSLLTLAGSAEKLSDDDLFSIVKVSSNDNSRVSVSATNEAAAGTFSVEVLGLAQARSLSTRSFTTLDNALALSGEIVINDKAVEIVAEDSLLDVRDSINDANSGVNAQILSVSATDNRLILTADVVGSKGFGIKDASSTDVLESLGFTSSETAVKTAFANGARSDQFLEDTTAIGTLLSLGSPAAGTITVGDQTIDVDLATDSINDIRDKITAAAPTGVTATVSSSSEGGLTRFQLEIDGTTTLVDNSGVLETLGVIDSGGGIVDEIIDGADSDVFSSTTTNVGALMGIGTAPSGTVQIAGQGVSIDLSSDSLTAIQTKINDAAISGVTATVTTASSEEGGSEFRLRIEGTTDFVDDANVLESLGVIIGSNSAFESVARVLTSGNTNQEKGAVLNPAGNGAESSQLTSDTDAAGTLVGSSAAGTVQIGDAQVAIDLTTDSLNAIRDKINAAGPTGVTAVVNVVGPSDFVLEIQGTTDFDDADGVLAAIGVVGASSALTANTKFEDVAGASVADGDTITISGTNHDGSQVSGTFTINSGSQSVNNLLSNIEQLFGNAASASLDASGRIVLADDQAGVSSLSLTLAANNEGGGSLSFGTHSATVAGADARSSELQAGEDAKFKVNGIDLTRASNTVDDAIQGVTLSLLDAEVGELVDVTVTKDDTSQVRSNIESFVADFNNAMEVIDTQIAVNPDTGEAGPLAGDPTILGVQSRLRNVIAGQIEGLQGGLDALVLAGVAFDRTGRLQVDGDRLTSALTDNLDQVRQLFTAQGNTSDGGVAFVGSTKNTRAGSYDVDITQAAVKAEVLGTADLLAGLAEDQTLTLSQSNTQKSTEIELKAGDTIDDIVAKINAAVDSDVAEVRRASIGNTTDGATAITDTTLIGQVFGSGVVDGDTIRIQGTTHNGNSVTSTFTIDDVNAKTMGDLLASVRNTFSGDVSTSIDSEGRIVVTDNQIGASSLTVTLVEENEGGGSLNFGSIDVAEEGRLPIEVEASNQDGKLKIQHTSFGARNGFSIAQSLDQLGIADAEISGQDVEGTINGEAAEGVGRILTGTDGDDSENTTGLGLRVSITDDELAASGSQRGTVGLIYGVGRKLEDVLSFITDNFDGTLTNREQSIDDTLESMDNQISTLERRVAQSRQNLVRKFASLEGSLATLQAEGNFLSQQLAGLAPRR